MKILVTGTAGFIGFHLAKQLLERGDTVIGLDNINDYYDPRLKYARLAKTGISESEIYYNKPVKSKTYPDYTFYKINLEDKEAIDKLFKKEKFEKVCHLAAQAGVRYSLTNPYAYIESNIVGFMNILEACRYYPVKHLVYASSSSVYGLNTKMPFSVHDNVDHPISKRRRYITGLDGHHVHLCFLSGCFFNCLYKIQQFYRVIVPYVVKFVRRF
ncbi:GDP-mannose 4,6-dehydratase [subsurface metagenome]